jgi:hypothetical protein
MSKLCEFKELLWDCKKLTLSKTKGKSNDEIREINKNICYKFDEILKAYKEVLNESI